MEIKRKLLLTLGLAFLLSGQALAQETVVQVEEEEERPWSLTIQNDLYSDYVLWGLNYYNGTSIQPSIDGSYSFGEYGAINANVWSHFSGEGGGSDDNFTEVDYETSYSYDIDDLTLTGGATWYSYPDKDDDLETEADYFFSAEYATILNPTLEYRKGMDTMKRDYIELTLSEQIGCEEGEMFTPYVTLGFTTAPDYYYENKGLVNLTIGSTLDNITWGYLDIIPSVNYTFKEDDYGANVFWFGLSMAYDF